MSGPTRFHKTMKRKLYAALDLHTARSVVGWMSVRGEMLGRRQFTTSEENLVEAVRSLPAREVFLTIEAGPITRWAADVLRPHVARLLVCDPRYNRLVSHASNKSDKIDVRALCELLRLDGLHPVWTGRDEDRAAFRAALYELLKLRDQQRQLRAHIKTRYRGVGILRLDGRALFHPAGREDWIALMPENRRHGLLLLYDLFDTAYGAWCEQLAEVVRLGRAYPEIQRFQQVPGIGEVGSHVFSAMVEDPHRFQTSRQLLRFCALGITSRSSDGKQLGYERIDRTGRRELKTVAYHAWRTGVRAGQPCDVVRRFYFESKRRTGTARHGRLNTERKILTTLWSMWKNDTDFDPERFLHNPGPPPKKRRARHRRRTRSRGG